MINAGWYYFAMLTLLLVYVRSFYLPSYLLYSNMTAGFYVNGHKKLSIFWFMEDYLLLSLALAGILLIPALRRALAKSKWITVLALFLLASVFRAFSMEYGHLPIFYPKAPLSIAWLFILGWLIHSADTTARKWTAMLLAGLHIAASLALYGGSTADVSGALVLATGLAVLLFVVQIPVGRVAAMLLSACAAASLYIYIAQPVVLQPVGQLYPSGAPIGAAIVFVVLCLLVGFGIWHVVSIGERIALQVRHRRWNEAAAVVRQHWRPKF